MQRSAEVDADPEGEPRVLSILPGGPVEARGKFLYVGSEKLYVRGVTYGTFRPDAAGDPYPEPDGVARDFAEMASRGINAVRLYTAPPRWLMDLAQQHGLRVMVGLPWEQHVAFLEDRETGRRIEKRVRDAVRSLRGHPALLAFAIGNEIPAPIVRWHGRRRVERFLARLYAAAKSESPGSLVTYVNYPTTEHLELPFLDLDCFNVYLESRDRLEAYLARLHNLCGERPLLMTEIGLDSRRNGEAAQAASLSWQLPCVFESGCAGAFVFSWTDEWYRGGHDIEDWDFGLTTRERRPKPALDAVVKAYAEVPIAGRPFPRVSVVVCSYNGAETIHDTLQALAKLDYPSYEVIVVDDGSTDDTARIARGYDVELISTENRGLSAARNTGWRAATGEIVAYIDDDAYPDPHWLTYLALGFLDSEHCGVGGPNIAPPDDGLFAECVASSPGGPAHVLLSDRIAEHVPGCNMAFRRSWLQKIEGFDPRFRRAGDDVDLCWRLQDQGGTIGFHPGAVVWHHRRGSVSRYWKQQVGYGQAEALLARKWPERFNTSGHVPWGGRIYSRGLTLPVLGFSRRIYQGTWGSAPFQALYESPGNRHWSLLLMPEWYLVVLAFALLTVLGAAWRPLLLAAPLLVLSAAVPVAQAARSAWRAARSPRGHGSGRARLAFVGLTTLLHLIQPAARLYGRLRNGLDPWRLRGVAGWRLPRTTSRAVWSEQWIAPSRWLEALESALADEGASVERGGAFDRWDLRMRWGPCGGATLLAAVEEHGSGRQYARFRVGPHVNRGRLLAALAGSTALAAALGGGGAAAAGFAAAAVGLGILTLGECGTAVGRMLGALEGLALGAPPLGSAPDAGTDAGPRGERDG